MNQSDLRNQSGMPLGGIGAGKVEFCPNGKFTNCTAANNWDTPIYGTGAALTGDTSNGAGIMGAFLARFVEGFGGQMLRTYGLGKIPPINEADIRFEARFPYARVKYAPLGDIDLVVEAFSPFCMDEAETDHYRSSSLPVAVFKYTLTNRGKEPRRAAIAQSWENLVGMGGYAGVLINHFNCRNAESFRNQKTAGVRFFSQKEQINPRTKGEYVLQAQLRPDLETTTLAGWNVRGDGSDFWDSFSRSGKLDERPAKSIGGAIGFQFTTLDGGGVAQATLLQPGETRELVYVLSWFFPRLLSPDATVDYGHAYQNWFGSAREVGLFVIDHLQELFDRTLAWQRRLEASNLPAWLVTKLCNDLAPLVNNSWYTRDYRFTLNESPTYMNGCMGTLDQRMASGGILAMCFPGLAAAELNLWAKQQVTEDDGFRHGKHWDCLTGKFGKDLDRLGAIRHDVGWDHLEGGDLGSSGWTLLHWPDLAPAFTVQCYNLAVWTGDDQFLRRMYPHIQKALQFVERLDQDGDGIPDLWGPGCCTYDNENFPYYGASSYIASLYLAALHVAERIARRYGDPVFAEYCAAKAARVGQAIEAKLWDEERGYFISWADESAPNWAGGPRPHSSRSSNCMVAQLAGEWPLKMFGMGSGVAPEQIERALEQIFRRNVLPVEGCPANEASPDGKLSFSWPYYVETYFTCAALYWGKADEALESLARINHAVTEVAQTPWDAPLVWEGPNNFTPGWGRWYMSAPASWFVLPAFAGAAFDALNSQLRIDPHIPAAIGAGKELRLPLFYPGFWMELFIRLGERSRELDLKLLKLIPSRGEVFRKVMLQIPKGLEQGKIQLMLNDLQGSVVYHSATGILEVDAGALFHHEGADLRIGVRW